LFNTKNMINYALELKNRFILLFTTWFSVVCVCYSYKESLLFLFLDSRFSSLPEFTLDYLIFTDISEVFSVYVNLCLFFGFQVSWIYFVYQSFIFISGALFKSEYYYLKYFIQMIFTFWLLSVFLVKYVLIPVICEFLFTFKTLSLMNLHFEAKLNQYFNFYKQTYSLFILYSQIFIVCLLFLEYFSTKVSSAKIYKKIYHFCFLIFATLFSPPDIFSQLAIGILLIIFYEAFLFWLILKRFIRLTFP